VFSARPFQLVEGVRYRDETWFSEVVMGEPKGAGGECDMPYFHRYVLQGVVDALEVLVNHWDSEIGLESWTAPAPSA